MTYGQRSSNNTVLHKKMSNKINRQFITTYKFITKTLYNQKCTAVFPTLKRHRNHNKMSCLTMNVTHEVFHVYTPKMNPLQSLLIKKLICGL